ncbi:MAG: AAA family ATPase [Flavobacteriales bacterium]|nr:AAA family ATPase [Flavobacteriales bacterium]
MEKSGASQIPVTEEQLNAYKEEVTALLKMVSWSPDHRNRPASNTQLDASFLMHVGKALNVGETDELSVLKNAVRISDDRTILTNTTNVVLNAIRKGFCMGKHLSVLFERSSGLELLQQKNNDGSLHQSEIPAFHDKLQTASAIQLFVASYYITYFLSNVHADEHASINIDFGGIPEVKLSRPSQAVQCAMYYYAAYLERSGVVKKDLELLKITLLYFERLKEEVLMRKGSLKDVEFFTSQNYKLEHSDFTVQGFDVAYSTQVKGIEFNATRMEEIVANEEAKHMFRRFAERLLCYDLIEQKNPMLVLGGMPSITMADGKPGTGKSMLIAAVATMLKERCEVLNMPFLFWPLPENIISTFQGGSAERAIEWFRPMQDTGKIVFAPIDDAENNLEERTRQGVSAGVREFIGVFLRNTEGAYAVNHGNRMISLFTNIPDQIDKAVLSRIQVRVSMEGAKRFEDFVDQDHLWWKKYRELDPKFIKDAGVKGYEFMSAQRQVGSMNELLNKGTGDLQNAELKTIYEASLKQHDAGTHEFFGTFYAAVLARFPFFSSRDLRNIQKAVDARVTDFDLPSTWWDKPDEFFFKDYATKLSMLKELMRSNLGHISFEEVRLQEAMNYLDNAIRINETGIDRQVERRAEEIYIQQKALELQAKKNAKK